MLSYISRPGWLASRKKKHPFYRPVYVPGGFSAMVLTELTVSRSILYIIICVEIVSEVSAE